VKTVRDAAQTRVLVTGATGTIGRHVLTELVARGYQVRALTSKPVVKASVSDSLEWRQLDFHESLDFDPLVEGCAAVLHLGAEVSLRSDRMQRSNVEATYAIAEASERAGVRVFCYTSSVAVYGNSRRRRVSEDSPVLTTERDVPSEYWTIDELRCYGRTKLQGELAIGAVAHNVEYVILRPTVVVDIQDLIALGDLSKAEKRRAGSRHAHNIYVYDVADAILWFMERALNREVPSPGLSKFNLSEDSIKVDTYGKIFKAAYEATGDRKWRVTAIPWPVEWIWSLLKFHSLPPRQCFGRMIFMEDKLREVGYTTPYGITHAVADFCDKLASTDTRRLQGQDRLTNFRR